MKHKFLWITLLVLALSLTACGGSPVQEPDIAPETSAQPESSPAESASSADAAESVTFNTDYENALSPKLLLSLGAMELASTKYPITAEQAELMLFYWQALNSMTESGNSAPEEVEAVMTQLEATFTPEQITAINQMQLTSEFMQTWAQENQITMGTGDNAGEKQGQGQGGGGGMDADARATKQAEEGNTSGTSSRENGLSAAINNALIAYLEALVQ